MRKYTLQELADLTGLTHGYVRDLECLTIDKTPLLETIGKFADALEIDIRQLFDDINCTDLLLPAAPACCFFTFLMRFFALYSIFVISALNVTGSIS